MVASHRYPLVAVGASHRLPLVVIVAKKCVLWLPNSRFCELLRWVRDRSNAELAERTI